MSAIFLFTPFPGTQSVTKGFDANLKQILGPQGSVASELSQNTKSTSPDDSSFQQYIVVLSALNGSALENEWTNPFRSKITYYSADSNSELAATLWNYMVHIHRSISKLDAVSIDQLKTAKALIADLNATCINFRNTCGKIEQHAFFNVKMADFIQAFSDYLADLLTFNVVMANNKGSKSATCTALQCVAQLKKCSDLSRHIEDEARSYFGPLLTAMTAYWNAFSYLHGAKLLDEGGEYGKALACYRRACEFTQHKVTLAYAPAIVTSLGMLGTLCKTAEIKAQNDNKTIYHAFVPGEVPPLPAPFKHINIEATKRLIIGYTETSALPPAGGYDEVQQTLVDSGPPPPPWQPENAPTQYPGPNQQQGPPVWIPPGQAPPHAPVDNFPQWQQLQGMKSQIVPKLQQLTTVPQYSSVATKLQAQLNQAFQSDNLIQQAIDQYNSGQSAMPKENIEAMIQQAFKFYQSIQERIRQLETTGQ